MLLGLCTLVLGHHNQNVICCSHYSPLSLEGAFQMRARPLGIVVTVSTVLSPQQLKSTAHLSNFFALHISFYQLPGPKYLAFTWNSKLKSHMAHTYSKLLHVSNGSPNIHSYFISKCVKTVHQKLGSLKALKKQHISFLPKF